MVHGHTIHGLQMQSPTRRDVPTTYYSRPSGIGLLLEHHPRRLARRPLRIGVIGLGTGTLACYAHSGDTLRYYEIDDKVVRLADQHFTFLAEAQARGADVDVYRGDARIVLEKQWLADQPQQFDVLAVDAFSSDAIPMHLLTAECFQLYWRHLKNNGVLAVHVSNRYLDLSPVVRKLAEIDEKEVLYISYRPNMDSDPPKELSMPSDWMLLSSDPEVLAMPTLASAHEPWPTASSPLVLWTDDFSSLWQVIR
jgi:hypothetical protein